MINACPISLSSARVKYLELRYLDIKINGFAGIASTFSATRRDDASEAQGDRAPPPPDAGTVAGVGEASRSDLVATEPRFGMVPAT
jgi:hypothetical protein